MDNKIEITNLMHTDMREDSDCIKKTGFMDYDSVTYSDGSYAVSMLQRAPQNWLIKYVDKDGRLMATISAASENEPQRIVYGYDDKDRLKYILQFDINLRRDFDFTEERCDSAYLHFRLAIDSLDFSRPDTCRHKLAEIEYSNEGYAYKVEDRASGKKITAPTGYKLNVSVDPCVCFWESDINGGFYYLKVDVVPLKKGNGDYFIKRFVDFKPTTEEYYQNGQLVKTVCHPNPNYPDDVKITTSCKRVNGANIYSLQFGNSTDTLISTWKDGLMQEEVIKSKWGTVLNVKRYYYLPLGKVKEEERRFDFKEKKLKSAVEKIINISDLLSEDDLINPLKNDSWWNVYGE
ncbi:hypothetical protein [Xylanibacter rarus]|uniref:hypothetical protein n=1 Tax=Xylanibacter rarus TaxID=1676614 RepID=UPI003AB92E7D